MPRVLESRLEFLRHIMTENPQIDSKSPLYPQEEKIYSLASDKSGSLSREITYKTFAPRTDSGAESKEFIQIYNVKKTLAESCAIARITPKQYLAAQELGMTVRNDQALTAKIIGCIGQYRFQVAEHQEKRRIRSTLFSQKEAICQNAIQRLRALQLIEKCHGDSRINLDQTIEQYRKKLSSAINEIEAQLKTQVGMSVIEKARLNALKLGLQADHNAFAKFERYMQRLPLVQISESGSNVSRDPVAHFIKERINAILAEARNANEQLTLAGANAGFFDKVGAFFRGSLHNALTQAFELNRYYIWDQHRAIRPEHQGDYSQHEHVTIYSTQLYDVGRKGLKKFLFGMNYLVLNPAYDLFSSSITSSAIKEPGKKIKPHGIRIYANRSQSSWLLRLAFWRKANGEMRDYQGLKKYAKEADLNLLVSALADAWMFLRTVGGWVWRTSKLSLLNLYAVMIDDLIKDFQWTAVELQSKKNGVAAAQEAELNAQEETAKGIIESANYAHAMNIAQQVRYSYSHQTAPAKALALSEVDKSFLQAMRAKDAAPLALPLYSLRPYSPTDAFSQLMNGAENFYRFFANYYEGSPSIALYSSAVYLLSAAAIINPALIPQLSKSLDFINSWSRVTAEAMSNSTYSQVVAAGFSAYKETLLTLQAATDGVDSTLAHALEFIETHWPHIVLGGAALAAAGYELSVLGDQVPVVGSEGGNVPGLEQTIVAAKVGVVVRESLHSEFGQQSLAARSITAALAIPMLLVRIFVFMPLNLMHWVIASLLITTEAKLRPPSVQQIFKPLTQDLPRLAVSILLRIADLSLRLLNLVFMALKVIPKTMVDWLVNNLATLANHFQMVLAGTAALLIILYALPPLGIVFSLIPGMAIAIGAALCTQILFSVIGINIKLPMVSAALLSAKHAGFAFCDRFITRPLKNLYESLRNQIARILIGEWMGEKDLKTYNKPIARTKIATFARGPETESPLCPGVRIIQSPLAVPNPTPTPTPAFSPNPIPSEATAVSSVEPCSEVANATAPVATSTIDLPATTGAGAVAIGTDGVDVPEVPRAVSSSLRAGGAALFAFVSPVLPSSNDSPPVADALPSAGLQP